MKFESYASVAAMATVLVGCARPQTESVVNPSRLHAIEGNSAITYDARGRGTYIENKAGRLRFCAEPPPDTSASTSAESSSSVNAGVDALIGAMTVKAALDTANSEQASSVVVDVATRTELLQVLRTATYRLCELNMNGVLTDDDARSAFDYILRTTRLLGQRDNVAKLIETLDSDLNDSLKQEVIKLILAMSWSESVAASTGLAEQSAQMRANDIMGETFRQLFLPGGQPTTPGVNDNRDETPGAPRGTTPAPAPGGGAQRSTTPGGAPR